MTGGGRPSDYSEAIAAEICELIANGRSLVTICKRDDMPHYSTVSRWLGKYDDFRENYALARADQADFLAEEVITVADDSTIPPDDRRIRIDARKWYAGKLKPKKYGDKTLHTGPDGEEPAVFTLNIDRRDKDV